MPEPTLRPVRAEDDAALAAVIRAVMPEFGASGPGTALHDPEVDALSAAYPGGRAQYFVALDGARVLGGAGFGPLIGAGPAVCELRKMYLLPAGRGRGLGRALLARCLEAARAAGYRRCYLETLDGMQRARALYEAAGFEQLCAPEGATGHFACDTWYARDLEGEP
ncbi:MAG: GNAT family N-acetyltransferase [Planctomycetota bacterium]